MKKIYSLLTAASISFGAFAQLTPIPENFDAEGVVVTSAADFQILFTGGVDVVYDEHTEEYALAKEWHDFLGFVEKGGKTYLITNHERNVADPVLGDGGGMTVWEVKQKADGSWERVGDFRNVDFRAVGGTVANCGGMQSKDGRIWTAEEWAQISNAQIYTNDYGATSADICKRVEASGFSDTNDVTISGSGIAFAEGETLKKYENLNWMVEVDVENAKAIRKQYNMGRFGHEGGAVSDDGKYVYLTDDNSPACFFRFEAKTAGDYTDGTLAFYKQDADKYTGTWENIPMTMENMVDAGNYAKNNGGTLFMRGEWIEVSNDGKVYWTATGRDNAGERFARYNASQMAKHNEDKGIIVGGAIDQTYADYYGRVLVYDPADASIKTFIEGGKAPNASDIHLSNPDGLTFLRQGSKEYMVICEDLNGIDASRMPADKQDRIVCELYLLDMATAASLDMDTRRDELKRIAVTPIGAEVTGARASNDGSTLFFNNQHPYFRNAAGKHNAYENDAYIDVYGIKDHFNHSMTVAINNIDDVIFTAVKDPEFDNSNDNLQVYPNPATRVLHLNKVSTGSLLNANGKAIQSFRNTNRVDILGLSAGTYFLQTNDNEVSKIVVE